MLPIGHLFAFPNEISFEVRDAGGRSTFYWDHFHRPLSLFEIYRDSVLSQPLSLLHHFPEVFRLFYC